MRNNNQLSNRLNFGECWIALVIILLSLSLTACGSGATANSKSSEQNVSSNPTVTNNVVQNSPSASNTNSGNAGSKIEPCQLVTKSEVEAILGGKVSQQQSSTQGPTVICSYKVENESFALSRVSVTINMTATSKEDLAAIAKGAIYEPGQTAQAIVGIGEAAYSVGQSFLFVTKNKTGFILYFPYGDKEPGTLEKARSLALKAVDRL